MSWSITPRSLRRLQDRLLALLGNLPDGRAPLVAAMLRCDATETTAYWLQLIVSIGIATLGLVVGSTAVVIGAMLVAPLMGPIVGLAMGLAVGSPILVLRSTIRVTLSVGFAIGGAALITVLLPFHELNPEIMARASPTALDLITAGFCALAGVYAALRPGSDSATAAAGTAISISLVPPLCASGYGVGTGMWSVAGGAALLFLTNMVAIVFVGTTSFVACGFGEVNVPTLERSDLDQHVSSGRLFRGVADRLSRVFDSRWGPVLRLLMPLLLLAGVYVPLRQALDDVSWQVTVRAAVRDIIAAEELKVVDSRVRVERREIDVVVVVLGKALDAERARARMDAEIRQVSGVAPRLEVLAVADASAIAGLESTIRAPQSPDAPAVRAMSFEEQLETAQLEISGTVHALWPSESSGIPLRVDIGAGIDGPLRIRVIHIGPALTPDTIEALQRSTARELKRPTVFEDIAIPSTPYDRRKGDLMFVAGVSTSLRATASVPEVNVCVTRPADAGTGATGTWADRDVERAMDELLAKAPRVTTVGAGAWSVLFSVAKCEPVQGERAAPELPFGDPPSDEDPVPPGPASEAPDAAPRDASTAPP